MSMINLLERHHYKVLLFLFITIYSLGFILLTYDGKRRVDTQLVDKLESASVEYKLIYKTYKKTSKLIYSNIKNDKKILELYGNLSDTNKDSSRQELYDIIKPLYKIAKKDGIKQLHFHLKNNESFLRMHRPNKFGDSLSEIRYSVVSVNKKHKTISGFEHGKVASAYRFVYPIRSLDREHLGSVEISIGTKSFERFFENTLFIDSSFIFDKNITVKKSFEDEVKKYYDVSLESPLYLQDKNQETMDENLMLYLKNNAKQYQKILKKKLKTKKSFSVKIQAGKDYYIKSFVAVKNIKDKKVVAYFITTVKSLYLEQLYRDSFILKIIFLFFTLLVVYIIDRNLRYSTELRKEIQTKTKELQDSQEKVVQAEKMASLGMLITGVAHELNTPMGLSITAITSFIDETKILKSDYESEKMDEEEFTNYLQKSSKTADIILVNLLRSAGLVKSFKQLSVNQNLKEIVEIDFKEYTDSLLISLDTKLKEKAVSVKVSIEKELKITTYVDVLPQIFNNFILNSLTHAFHNINNPQIYIEIKKINANIAIDYHDNGVGMDDSTINKIFDPFYTTNRGAGNSGLGMHVVYSLIVDKLDGTIDAQSQINNGVHISVTLPTVGK